MSRTGLVVLGASVASLAAGAGLGYFVANKQLKAKYEALSEREIAEAKKFYSVLYKKTDDTKTPQDAATSLIPNASEAAKAMLRYQGVVDNEEVSVVVGAPGSQEWHVSETEDDEEVSPAGTTREYREWISSEVHNTGDEAEPEEIVRNVFDDPRAPSNFPDFEAEVKNRTEEAPYVITQEEALENETSYMQSTLTYFAGDNVLVDERDTPFENPDSTVGLNNLVRFGQWSNDPKIVYVRNEVLEMIYEIVKSDGKYSVEVLGLPEEEEPKPKPRRRSSKARTGGGDDG